MSDQLPAGYHFAPMSSDEVHTIAQWAADEQWNPGLHDIHIAHAYDPDAFIALRHGDEMVGGGSIFSYHGQFGFMGLFIMRPDHRGRGLGGVLWRHRLGLLRTRLAPEAAIGMDGVFAMAPFYARGGFQLAYRDLRFDGVAVHGSDQGLVPVADIGFDAVAEYDRPFHPVDRSVFLRSWVMHPAFHSAAVVEHGSVVGYASLRPCRSGWRFGPVAADTPAIAERLLVGLMGRVAGEPVQLDVPEPNEVGLALAAGFGMTESFGCARMYHGHVPTIAVDRTYGVTSFEFG
jgi:GNAT superfamily N-acetyltransferase